MTSTSPSTSFSGIAPKKHAPNAHPYAIKTTSTGLLTRSNSSPNAKSTRHYYVPLSPSPSPSPSGSESEGPGGPAEWKGRGHRYTASWEARQALPSADEPPRNPKLWAPAHLIAYVSRSLPDDAEATDWVRERGMSGKAFLRLSESDDASYVELITVYEMYKIDTLLIESRISS